MLRATPPEYFSSPSREYPTASLRSTVQRLEQSEKPVAVVVLKGFKVHRITMLEKAALQQSTVRS